MNEDLIALSTKANEVEDWSTASDLAVGRAMKENEKLRKEYTRINNVKRDIDELMAEYGLEDEADGLNVHECDLQLNEVHEEVEQTVKAVEDEDNARELYSLDEAKVDKIKLPTFGGKESEDYEKFKSDLLKGFAQNRVTQADKLSKLRECLYGDAKRLVPQSISSSADDALKVLDKAYGEPTRLFRYRKDYFYKLGKQPKENDKGGFKAQLEWLREAEVALESLYTLALKDKECAAELFNPTEMTKCLKMFDLREGKKLVKCEGFGETKFKKWLTMIGEFREEAQMYSLQLDGGSKPSKESSGPGNNKGNQSSKAMHPTLAMFKPPRRHEDCRICNKLSKTGDTKMLYDNHSSSFPSGCPRFIGMSIAERVKVCKDAKICVKCNDPSYVWKFADIRTNKHKCVSKSSKSRYVWIAMFIFGVVVFIKQKMKNP